MLRRIARTWRRAKRTIGLAIDVTCGMILYGVVPGIVYLVWTHFFR